MGLVSPGDPRALSHLLLLLLLLQESSLESDTGTHTLRYDLMALSLDRPEKSQFLALGYFDDELFLRYDGESQRAEPRGLGIKMDLGAETWERETKDLKEKERQLRQMLTEIMGQQGQGPGLHSLQATLGCELQGDLTVRGFWRLGYNGQDQDFLTFNSETLPWSVATPSAQHIKKLWETQDPPSVTVTRSKNLVGHVLLRCWVFSFYPRGATLTWLRDGEPMHQGSFGPGANLPSGDGNYQTWVATWIPPGEEQRFVCHVGHWGLNTTVPAVSGEEPGEPSGSRELEAVLVQEHHMKKAHCV
ncbi:MHC class I-like protein MILL2 [Diceros bicornis minor]|uniref:MHC class I-like protein MILL2 n=1 Tax=Diceros bicornis minor TaxID=77932 RepID=UPI0026F22D68|nr:MHC class I-like protein MILL2 [Diceros bicornis minor]